MEFTQNRQAIAGIITPVIVRIPLWQEFFFTKRQFMALCQTAHELSQQLMKRKEEI
jgi:hypothetical protein